MASTTTETSGGYRVLIGHADANVRRRVRQTLEASGLVALEAQHPLSMRTLLKTVAAHVIVCPPGWIDDISRKVLSQKGTRVVDIDPDSVSPMALVGLVQAAAARPPTGPVAPSAGREDARTPSPRETHRMTPPPGAPESQRMTPPPSPARRAGDLDARVAAVIRASTPPPGARSAVRGVTPGVPPGPQGQRPERQSEPAPKGAKQGPSPAVIAAVALGFVVLLVVVVCAQL